MYVYLAVLCYCLITIHKLCYIIYVPSYILLLYKTLFSDERANKYKILIVPCTNITVHVAPSNLNIVFILLYCNKHSGFYSVIVDFKTHKIKRNVKKFEAINSSLL